jgi:DNA-binding CsgD family transcriptional regulator
MDQDIAKLTREDRRRDVGNSAFIIENSPPPSQNLHRRGVSDSQPPPAPPRLTQREREVLRWTAEGKTAFEIGIIVGLTERTVNFHIRHVLAKFEATNKTQAAVKATVMGLLF